ncbi:MAG: GNAT family N-acetyltransferase [Promethearchaeota archaeon]
MLRTRGLKKEEFPHALYPLLERCFTGSAEDRRFYTLHYERPYGKPSWEYSRVGVLDGVLVSHIAIWKFAVSFAGGTVLSAGGIRDVCTDPNHRKKGYGHKVLQDAVTFMKKEHLDISLLYAGPRKFYGQKGWQVAIPSYSFTLDSTAIPRGAGHALEFIKLEELQSVTPSIVERLLEIREITSKPLNCVVQRDLDYFTRLIDVNFREGRKDQHTVVVRDINRGEIIGYLLFTTGERDGVGSMDISEARLVRDSEDKVMVQVLEKLTAMYNPASIHVALSPSHGICRVVLGLGARDDSTILSGCMVKILNVGRFLEALVSSANYRIERDGISLGSKGVVTFMLGVSERDGADPSDIFKITFNPDSNSSRWFSMDRSSMIEDGTFNSTVRLTHEGLLSILFSPVLGAAEAVEDEFIEVKGVDVGILELLLDGITWDKENRDYF